MRKCCGGKDGRARWQQSISRNKLRYCPRRVRSCPQDEYRSIKTGVIGLRLPSPILQLTVKAGNSLFLAGDLSFVILRLDAYDDDLVTFPPRRLPPCVCLLARPLRVYALAALPRRRLQSIPMHTSTLAGCVSHPSVKGVSILSKSFQFTYSCAREDKTTHCVCGGM